MARTRLRYQVVRTADHTDDQKTASAIAAALGTSVTQEDLQEYVLSQLKRIIHGDSAGHWYDDFAGAGVPSLSETESVQVVPFTYATGSPMVLQSVMSGDLIERAIVVISVAFDGPGAQVTLGTSGVPDMVLSATDVFPNFVAQFNSSEVIVFPVADILQLTIVPAGSSQGTGLLVYKFRS